MKIAGASFVALLLLTASFCLPLVSANEAPLADAGLDQDVSRGTTVHLDATGSRDPDGRLERYDWSVEGPSGETTTPDCSNCSRTRFEPDAVGTYTVTLTVTDDDGATSTDTLFVTVSPGESPTIDLTGPRNTAAGESNTYSATIDAGTAALDHVVWSVDGTDVTTRTLSGAQGVDTLTRVFPGAGTRTVTATVVDADGQRAIEMVSVSVSATPSAPPEPPASRPSIADRRTPTIEGDDVVTGATPLRGTYQLAFDGGSRHVASVEWMGDSRHVGTGRSMTTTWSSGDHSLYAIVTYTDGSTDVARFDDGSTTVVADPQPRVSLSSLDTHDAVSGTAFGTDDYGNLWTVTVKLDGEVIDRSELSLERGSMLHRQQEVRFAHRDFDSNESYDLTVVAVDGRGQRTNVTKTIEPTKSPDIVESGFVNGPVDSYHERIDRNRYAAHHRLKIDLNGMDPSGIIVRYLQKSGNMRQLESLQERRVEQNYLIIDRYWAGDRPKNYSIATKVVATNSNGRRIYVESRDSAFEVTPSPPELRVEVIDDGTSKHRPLDWGIVVDAGASFDPDGTKIRYLWSHGAQPINKDNSTAKFTHTEIVSLSIKDGDRQVTSQNFQFLSRYVPSIQDTKILNNKTYRSKDNVRIRFETEKYRFPKNRYHKGFKLGAELIGATGSVVRWEKKVVDPENDSNHIDDPRKYVGVVEIDASELAGNIDSPRVRIFNERHHETSNEVTLPEVTVLRKYGRVWKNVTVEDIEYLVKRPVYDWVTVDSPTERKRYENNGYSVTEKRQDGLQYLIEERVKVSDARYRTLTKTFDSKWGRSAFVDQYPTWSAAGATTREITQTVTESMWRNTKSGRGTFTGETRTVETKPAEYRHLKQFAYEQTVEKTGTRTVTGTRDVTVTKTGTKTVRKCPTPNLCYDVEKTTTYQTTVQRTYTTTETYTYTVSRTRTYWATRKMGRNHWATGKRKRVKVSDAKYETQYRYEYSVEQTETVLQYDATRQKKVRDARYEWQEKTSVAQLSDAQSYVRADGYRIGGMEPIVRWTLAKPEGTQTKRVPVYLKKDEVIETYATVTGDVKRKFVYVGEDRTKFVDLGKRTVDEQFYGKLSRAEIRERAGESDGGSRTDGPCLSRGNCITT